MFKLKLVDHEFFINNRFPYVERLCRDYTVPMSGAESESGAGKSTHRRLWQERFGEKLTVINDDKPLLAFKYGEIRVFGTPYAGKDSSQPNTNARVCGFLFIKQAKANSVRRLSKKEALPLLLNQIYRVNDKAGIVKTLDLALRLAEIPVFELSCTISAEAVEIAYNALKNET